MIIENNLILQIFGYNFCMRTHHDFSSVKRRLLRFHPSAFLLVAQLIMLILYAIFDGSHSQRALISAFSAGILVLVVWVVSASSSIAWLTWGLAVPTFVLSVLSAIFTNTILFALSSLIEAVLYFYTAGSLIVYMFGDDRVTTDELFALGATFTLLAWGFAYLYMVCQIWIPNSFVSSMILYRPLTFIEYLSLSFTNLTATGLGDILPMNPAGRILVMLTQFTGVGYVAMVVSRLISMSTQKRIAKFH